MIMPNTIVLSMQAHCSKENVKPPKMHEAKGCCMLKLMPLLGLKGGSSKDVGFAKGAWLLLSA